MRFLSIMINSVIFLSTLVIVLRYFRKEGHWDHERGKTAFRFFTCQSNVLCAVAALFMALAQIKGTIPFGIWLLKYLGTVTVTVTMMTVFLYLGPTMGGYKELLAGENLYMHLIGPLLAIVSFCIIERGYMSLQIAFLGVVPVICYGLLYLYKIKFAAEDTQWPDFYGFNKTGNWPVSYVAMVAGTIVICMILRVLG